MKNLNTTVIHTKENKAKVKALMSIKETQWVGEVTHDSLDKCLTAINLFQGSNSGWYNARAIRIEGVNGMFMINQDGSINYESRVIKVSDNKFKIEHLSNEGFNIFEKIYCDNI